MSPRDEVQPGSPAASQYRFYPVELHPEFGYLAPRLRLRPRFSMVATGIAFGLAVGVIGTMLVAQHRSAPPQPLIASAEAARDHATASPPPKYVAASFAMQAVTVFARQPDAMAPGASSTVLSESAERPPVARRSELKRVSKVKRKVRTIRPERHQRAVEPDPRSAYAGPRYSDPRGNWMGQRSFGFGW